MRHRRGTAPDPRPRSGCTPGLSCAADARGCTELGSRAKPGLGPRRSPQSAVSRRRRTKCRFAIALRSRGASARLRRCARERPQPRAAAGCKMPFMAMSLVPMGLNLEGSLRRRASKLPPSTNADEARAGCQYASAIRPMSSAHNAAEPRSWCQKLCTLMPMSVGRNADGHRDYHYLGLQVPMPKRLGCWAGCQYAPRHSGPRLAPVVLPSLGHHAHSYAPCT